MRQVRARLERVGGRGVRSPTTLAGIVLGDVASRAASGRRAGAPHQPDAYPLDATDEARGLEYSGSVGV